MLTYQVRPRKFRSDKPLPPFPADVQIRFHFEPPQPFGMKADGGRTVVRGEPARALMNANTGAHSIESNQPLKPLEVVIDVTSPTTNKLMRRIELKGNILHLNERFDTVRELHDVIQSMYYGMPFLFNLEFSDPPFISHVDGTVGDCEFRWELADWSMQFRTTTQTEQETAIARSWDRFVLMGQHPEYRRVLAAIHYFHVGCRLAIVASTAGEFLAEVLLNFSKILEVLFPSSDTCGTIDAARTGLRGMGISEEIVEGSLLPALALRNHIDVGHVGLALFKMEDLKILHAYTERAENAFRDLLTRILSDIETSQCSISPHNESSPRPEALRIIERMRRFTPDTSVNSP